MCGLNRFSVSVKDIPEDELESALRVLTRSFNICSMVIRRRGGSGTGGSYG